MFERYTEKARRVVFFARYEASQFGSLEIDTDHLLLGLLREDKALTNQLLSKHASVESIRKQIEGHTTIREKVSTSIDLPLSNECKRALAYAAEEAERLSQQHVGTEHLLLGLLREEKCFAAELLRERGLQLAEIREQLAQSGHVQVQPETIRPVLPGAFSRDLTQAAAKGQLDPLIGRENELDRLIQVLCRRTNDNAVLVGEPGVGKRTIVNGLAHRIASGDVPKVLRQKSILVPDVLSLAAVEHNPGLATRFHQSLIERDTLFVVDELHLPQTITKNSDDVKDILRRLIASGRIQCISLATPSGYTESTKADNWLKRCFQSIPVVPASEAEALGVLQGLKGAYEKFHDVVYDDDAITAAVHYASACLNRHQLPGKAVDILDEAGASGHPSEPPGEVGECKKRIKFIVHRMENAILNYEFEKARFYSDEERKERENLRHLCEKQEISEAKKITRDDIENAVARITGMLLAAIRQAGSAGSPNQQKPD